MNLSICLKSTHPFNSPLERGKEGVCSGLLINSLYKSGVHLIRDSPNGISVISGLFKRNLY